MALSAAVWCFFTGCYRWGDFWQWWHESCLTSSHFNVRKVQVGTFSLLWRTLLCVCMSYTVHCVCVCVFVFGRWFLRVAVCSQWKAKRKHVHFRALQPGNPEVRTTFLWRCLSCSTDNSSDREQELCVMFLHNSQIKGDRASTSTQHLPAGQVPRSLS